VDLSQLGFVETLEPRVGYDFFPPCNFQTVMHGLTSVRKFLQLSLIMYVSVCWSQASLGVVSALEGDCVGNGLKTGVLLTCK